MKLSSVYTEQSSWCLVDFVYFSSNRNKRNHLLILELIIIRIDAIRSRNKHELCLFYMKNVELNWNDLDFKAKLSLAPFVPTSRA